MRALAALVLLAGCGTQVAQTPDQVACEARANDDPVVKELIMKGVGNPHFQREGQEQLGAARQDATLACLRARGLVQPGGVQRQKPLS